MHFDECDSGTPPSRPGFEKKLKAIAKRAVEARTLQKVKAAFRDSYSRFEDEWKVEKKAKGGKGDVLSAFAARLSMNRTTANRYLSGRIKRTDPATLTTYLRRIGLTLKDVLPSAEESDRAILAATVAEMMKARGIQRPALPLSSEEVDRVISMMERFPVPSSAIDSREGWRRWFEDTLPAVREFLDPSPTSDIEPDVVRIALLSACDAQALEKHLWSGDKRRGLWQIIAALLGLEAAEAQAAERAVSSDDWFEGYHRTPKGFAEYLLGGMDNMSRTFLDYLVEKGNLNLLRSMLRSRSRERSRFLVDRIEAFVRETDSNQYCRAQILRAQLFFDLGDDAGASNSVNNAWRKFMNREETISFDELAKLICKEFAPDPRKFLDERRDFNELLPGSPGSTPRHDVCREFFLRPLVIEVKGRGWKWAW